MQSQRSSLLWLVIAVLFLVGAGLYYYFFFVAPMTLPVPTTETEDGTVITPEVETMEELSGYEGDRLIPPVATDRSVPTPDFRDHVMGRGDARVTVIAYSDLGNQYIRVIQPALEEMQQSRPADMNIAWRHTPQTDMDWYLAQAAECVDELAGSAAFWDFIHEVLAEQEPSESIAVTFGESLDIDQEEYADCLKPDTEILQPQIAVDAMQIAVDHITDAQVDGQMSVTPSFVFIDNRSGDQRFIDGAATDAYIAATLDEMLK